MSHQGHEAPAYRGSKAIGGEAKQAMTQASTITRIRHILPQGQTLPEDEWRRRHHAMVGILFLEAVALSIFALVQDYSLLHSLEHGLPLIPFGVAALMVEQHRRLAAVLVSIGLITACALLVHSWNGAIEGHFLFFVTIVVLALYEDWVPFLIAAAYVVVHHGLTGVIDPGGVYNHPDAIANPWKWAGIHGFFVILAGAAAVAAWRLNETVRAEAAEAHRQTKLAAEKLAYQALHDELTGLPNRRSLFADLDRKLPDATAESPIVLELFDLNGFKDYNDTYGHPAGDALLSRVGKRLAKALEGTGTAYRMGGDEFCVLGRVGEGDADAIASSAATALAEHGEGFKVTASYGHVVIPTEATTAQEAVRLADERMYVRKGLDSRASAGRQSADVLLSILSERNPALGVHLGRVTSYAEAVAKRLGLPDEQAAPMLQAASLHDTGKAAIPDEILLKPGVLDDDEWEFIRRHTEIGERILSAAPALRRAAKLVRSSHEHFDGQGYPDGLVGEEIPIGARIIAVCDAFDAMLTERPYRRARSSKAALGELERCAGTQFDPEVVSAFAAVLEERESVTGAEITVS
jgi:diguanylate cyclase (GGDEF)-like protein